MNIIILKWVLTNFTLLEVAQPDVTQTTVEMLQSDWAATIVAAKTNPDIGLKPYLPSGTVGLRPTSPHPHLQRAVTDSEVNDVVPGKQLLSSLCACCECDL